jgi:signal transduction histidine kinase/CheY-like chemotaxis protein
LSSALLVTLVAATLLYVRARAGGAVNVRIQQELINARDTIRRADRDRIDQLRETATLIASFPDFKALLETRDQATVRDFLLTYLLQNERSELLVALDPSGAVIARTDVDSQAALPAARARWIDPALEEGYTENLLSADGVVYNAVGVAAEASGTVFGFVIAGVPVDDSYSTSLRRGDVEVVLARDGILGATVPRDLLSLDIVEGWGDGASAGAFHDVRVGDELFLATSTTLGGPTPGLLAVVMMSRDRALAPYREFEIALVGLGLLVIGLGMGGSALLARTITAPVAKLVEGTRAVAAGNLDYRLHVKTRDEIGALAESFNTMVDTRRRLEDQVRQSQKMEAVGRLAGGVAHDFNNLLMVVAGRSEALLARLAPDDPQRRDLELIRETSRRATAVTRQLLAFSRRQILQPRLVDLNSLVSGMADMLHRLIGDDVILQLALSPDIPRVTADPGQMEQVIMNLVINGRDAMPDGGVLTIQTQRMVFREPHLTGLMTVPPGRYVTISIADTGHGIDEAVLPHVFEPFFTTKDTSKGTGLGLSTVYGIVQQSNGFIDVQSESRLGATFTVLLPEALRAADVAVPQVAGAPAGMGSEIVMLVEDERDVRELIEEMLRAAGYHVLTAADGHEAIGMARVYAGPIHVLLTDMVMPGMRGPTLARQLQASRPDLRVLFMSGYADPVTDVADGVAGLLQKPFSAAELLRRIRDVLQSPLVPVGAGR